MESSVDLAKKIAETLNWKLVAVEDFFDISEDKKGFFVLTLKPKKFMDTADFRAVCALTRDLGGEDGYVKFSRSWKVPSRFVKKEGIKPEKPPAQPTAKPEVMSVKPGYYEAFSVDKIVSPAFTLRLNIKDKIKELADQICATGVNGEQCVILEPLVCRPGGKPGYLELAAGERRLLAVKSLSLTTVPVVVKELSDEEFDRVRFMENFAREDLTDYEKARGLKNLMDKYPRTYPTQKVVAEIFGKTEGRISQILSMLDLEKIYPGKLQLSARARAQLGDITERQAREILSAPPDKQEEIIDQINKTGEVPSSREIEKQVKSVPCAECGELTSDPINTKDGKFYCSEECKQDAEAKAASDTGEVSAEEPEKETTEEPAKPSEKPVKPEPLLTGYPWTCPDCGAKLIINHVDYPNSDKKEHRLEACGQ